MKSPCFIVLLFLPLLPEVAGASTPAEEAAVIDRLLAADWQKHGLQANPPASDETLVRRFYLDIVGRIPTLAETRAFLDDPRPDKRARLIDDLLVSEGHTSHFFHWWADLLRVFTGPGVAGICGREYRRHMIDTVRANKPYDAVVRELLTADGDVWDNPAIGYYMRDRAMPLDNTAITTRVFLGTRIECAQCHDHPFDKWTQLQFYQAASYTYGYDTTDYYGPVFTTAKDMVLKADQRDGLNSHRAELVGVMLSVVPLRNNSIKWFDGRQPKLPHDYQYENAKPLSPVAPMVPLGEAPDLTKHKRSAEAYAAWMTASENPRFTRVIANRMWKKVFGRGLFEPVDEILDDTVPVNPELMTALENLMIRQGYDLRAFQRVLYLTRAYQSRVSPREAVAGEDYRFTGPLLRRMSAEQIWDSFVTLVRPDIEARDLEYDRKSRHRTAVRRKLDDAMNLLKPEDWIASTKAIAPIQQAQNAKVKALQDQLSAERAAKKPDQAKMTAIGKEMAETLKSYLTAISTEIHMPAIKKLAEKVAPGHVVEIPPLPDAAAMAQQVVGDPTGYYERLKVPGYEIEAPNFDTLFREEVTRDAEKLPEKERAEYRAYRVKAQVAGWFRAIELTSPAPIGHPLRELGQSDREIVENANAEASIPQALLLMNSPLLADVLHPQSALRRGLPCEGSPAEMAEAVYMSLLSRKPSAAEIEIWQKSGHTTVDDLIFLLLNTQQYLFIQ
jgi:hypothetical protein